MFDRLRAPVLRIMRVPHDPDPPAGAPGSVQVFRAGRNFYKLRLLGWAMGQLGALIGIVLSLTFLEQLEQGVHEARREQQLRQAATIQEPAPAPLAAPEVPAATAVAPEAAAVETKTKVRAKSTQRGRSPINRIAARWPSWLFPLLTLLEGFGVLLYIVQIPFTYAMARLDYELRWYIVTDRSLRIRAGLASVKETTMSFANLQQVIVSQGPLQRMLGIADVQVQSAGGGSEHPKGGAGDSLHTGTFHGVDNASQIRDLILERLRQFRETGLGDPDESRARRPIVPTDSSHHDALAAAQELLAEARALRHALR